MNLRYGLDEILIKDDQKITDKTINNSFQKLIENDFSIFSNSDMEPQIWECKWFNNPNEKGYSQGDAFWLNTESIDDLVISKHSQIYEYARNNSYLKDKIKKYEYNNAEIHELYKNILSGYYDRKYNIRLSALFEIGDLKEKTQIRISKIDNNKYSIFDDNYWMDFFVREGSIENLDSIFNNVLSDHIEKYHLSGENVNLDDYANIEMNNISKVQKLMNHTCEIHNSTRYGFDYLISNEIEYGDNVILVDILSVYDYSTISNWYELTGDTVYTLNNSIKKDELESKLRNVINYSQLEQFFSTLLDDEGFGDITFQLSTSNPSGYTYPNYFKYTEEQYEKVEMLLNKYYISQYCIGKIVTDSPSEDLKSFYTLKTPTIITSLDDIEEEFQNRYILQSFETLSSVTINTTREISLFDSWVKYYNSGIVVQGGFVNCGGNSGDVIMTIPLKQPYEYIITTKSMYGEVTHITEDIEFNPSNSLRENNRYTISISPISNSYNDGDNIEIVGIRNNEFDVLIKKNSPPMFQYQVQGIIGSD